MRKYWLAVYRLNIEVYQVAAYNFETGQLVTRVYRELDSATPSQ